MKHRTTLVVALLGTVLLAGCAGTDTKTSTAATVAPSAAGTVSASATPTPTAAVQPAGSSGAAVLKAAQSAALSKKTVRVQIDTAAAGQNVTGAGVYDFTPGALRAEVKMTIAGMGDVDVVLADGAMYFGGGANMAKDLGKPWVKISPNGTDPVSKALGPILEQLQTQADPTSGLGVLAGVPDLAAAGTETLDGVETTKYTATVDLAKALAALPAEQKALLQPALDAGTTSEDLTLWIGTQVHLIRKAVTGLQVKGQPATTTATYSKWGEPVQITVPSPDQVVDAASVQG